MHKWRLHLNNNAHTSLASHSSENSFVLKYESEARLRMYKVLLFKFRRHFCKGFKQSLLHSFLTIFTLQSLSSQRPRSFWSAPRITTSGPVQRHSVFEWLCKHNRLRPEPIRFVRFVRLYSEPAQSDGKSTVANSHYQPS